MLEVGETRNGDSVEPDVDFQSLFPIQQIIKTSVPFIDRCLKTLTMDPNGRNEMILIKAVSTLIDNSVPQIKSNVL